jgi:phosphotransferase system  glucose/maltose/N-acetylglucosamine-specific IIC component
MDAHIFIALVGALLNMGLSVTIPCLIKKTEQPFLTQVKKVFETNRQVILTSSLIVAITIYLALKVAPEIQSGFSGLTGIDIDSTVSPSEFNRPPAIVSSVNELPPQLRNLVKLMENQ